ncbi:MAG: hypothetical protein MIO93_12830 [ANME-2 cluster archaeon]|nr:hypothetical protein [ANME-2 cluster archaeon]
MSTPAFTPELILGIIGTITGTLSLAISMYFNRKAIGQADKALEQADKNLQSQLLYEDKKKALMNFQQIINNSTYKELYKKIEHFSESFEGKYVPSVVFSEIRKLVSELEKFEDTNSPYPTGREFNGEPPNSDGYDEDPHLGLNEYEIFDIDLRNEIYKFKNSVRRIITNNLTKI